MCPEVVSIFVEVKVAQTTPLPAVAPFADKLSVPPGWVGVAPVYWVAAVVVILFPLKR